MQERERPIQRVETVKLGRGDVVLWLERWSRQSVRD